MCVATATNLFVQYIPIVLTTADFTMSLQYFIWLQQIFNSLRYLLEFWYSDSKTNIWYSFSYVVHSCRMSCLPAFLWQVASSLAVQIQINTKM